MSDLVEKVAFAIAPLRDPNVSLGDVSRYAIAVVLREQHKRLTEVFPDNKEIDAALRGYSLEVGIDI